MGSIVSHQSHLNGAAAQRVPANNNHLNGAAAQRVPANNNHLNGAAAQRVPANNNHLNGAAAQRVPANNDDIIKLNFVRNLSTVMKNITDEYEPYEMSNLDVSVVYVRIIELLYETSINLDQINAELNKFQQFDKIDVKTFDFITQLRTDIRKLIL